MLLDEKIEFPDSVTTIMSYTFACMRDLTELKLGSGVEFIGENAFYNDYNVSSIIIPSSVTTIDGYAFQSMESLNDIYYRGSETDWENIKFGRYVFDSDSEITYHYNYCTENTNHSYVKGGTVAPTCNRKGYTKNVCDHCGDIKKTDLVENKHTALTTKVIEPTCTDQGYTIYSCSDCELEYHSDFKAKTEHDYKTTTTKATLSANGKIVKKCSGCKKEITTTIYSPKTITLSATSYTYDGKEKKPTVTVKDSKGNKISSGNYTVTYASGRKNVGQYSVKVTFKGNYSGTKTLTYVINPKATGISSLKAKSKGFTAKWKKQPSQTTGYQVQYSTSNKFKNAKTITVSGSPTTSKSISNLAKNKKYYVRIRTYKTVNKAKYYSSWSTSKAVKTK